MERPTRTVGRGVLASLVLLALATGCSREKEKPPGGRDGSSPSPTATTSTTPSLPPAAEKRPRIEDLIGELRLTSIRQITLPEGTFEVVPPIVEKLEAIGRLVLPHVLPETRNPRAEVRYWSARILGNAGDASVIDPLIALLGDPDDRVIAQASESLGKVRDRNTIPLVFSAIDEGKVVQVRWGVVLGQPRPEDWELVPYLISRLDSPAPFSRTSAEILLNLVTGQSFGFDPNASREDQKKAILKWEAWWRANRDKRPPEGEAAS